MAVCIQVENLTKSYGDRLLFESVTFGINEGDKIALIAKNGTGKTTLLRLLAGNDSPDSGTITFRNGLKVGFLDQTPDFLHAATPLEACMQNVEIFHDEDRWTASDNAMQMLGQLGVDDVEQPLDKMSGGQLKRVAIARLLLSNPDVLILDEPTNHLDIKAVEWLEKYLCRSRCTLLMVTHDRYFLDRICDNIIEIDFKTTYHYQGNYAYYLQRRAERLETMASQLAKDKNTLRREQEWMRRQPQARAGKAKYRIDAFYDLRQRASVRLDEKNIDPSQIKSSYIGSKIFEAENICKKFGAKIILDQFSYTFSRYEKLGIIGGNGVGKSTFVKMLQGLLPQDSGQWNVGETVRFGYYSQEGITFDKSKKVIDAVTAIADDIVMDGATHYSPMQFLTRFLFTPADQQKYIATLSGGEMRRLQLAVTLIKQPNFLILDEPTNDLDIMTLGILEEYLRNFKGCVIIISHDRFFLDSIVDHLFVMEGNGVIKDFPGNYSDYRQYVDEQTKQIAQAQKQTAPTRQPATQRPEKMTFKERKEFEALTLEIDNLTKEKTQLDTLFNSGQVIADVDKLYERYSQLKSILDEKEMRWLELSEKS